VQSFGQKRTVNKVGDGMQLKKTIYVVMYQAKTLISKFI